jgi:signal transduction histidine kinase
MQSRHTTKQKKIQRGLRLTGAIIALGVGVIPPVILSTSVGIVALVVGEGSLSLIFGVLVISFTSAAVAGAILVTVLLGRRARTARLQADLLANITHELRTPLSAIRMYAQTLEMGLVDSKPEQRKMCVDTIIRETKWLETMIDRVLTWRSLAKDRANLDFVREPVAEVVRDTATHFHKMTSPEEVAFEVHIDTSTPVWHDKPGIRSIVLNLLVNAYKYTRTHKVISLDVTDQEERGVLIIVKDNGIGIPEKEINRIMEPFYRVDSRLRQKAPGAGLGLAIVSHLVYAHSGEVKVASKEGEGSTFRVFLPKAEAGRMRADED